MQIHARPYEHTQTHAVLSHADWVLMSCWQWLMARENDLLTPTVWLGRACFINMNTHTHTHTQTHRHTHTHTHTHLKAHTNAYTCIPVHGRTQIISDTQKHRKWVCLNLKGSYVGCRTVNSTSISAVNCIEFLKHSIKRKWEVHHLLSIHIQSTHFTNNKDLSTFFLFHLDFLFWICKHFSSHLPMFSLSSLYLDSAFLTVFKSHLAKLMSLPQPSSKTSLIDGVRILPDGADGQLVAQPGSNFTL